MNIVTELSVNPTDIHDILPENQFEVLAVQHNSDGLDVSLRQDHNSREDNNTCGDFLPFDIFEESGKSNNKKYN